MDSEKLSKNFCLQYEETKVDKKERERECCQCSFTDGEGDKP